MTFRSSIGPSKKDDQHQLKPDSSWTSVSTAAGGSIGEGWGAVQAAQRSAGENRVYNRSLTRLRRKNYPRQKPKFDLYPGVQIGDTDTDDYWASRRTAPGTESARYRIAFAMMMLAIKDVQEWSDTPSETRMQLNAWMHEPDYRYDHDDPRRNFSFEKTCEILDLDPDYMRRGLEAGKLAQRKTPQYWKTRAW